MARPGSLRAQPASAVSAMAACWLLAGVAAAAEPVHLELVLAVDCSSSVNAQEFTLQMEGIAAAFEDDEVLATIERTGERGIAVALLQWSSAGARAEAVPWTRISGRTAALDFAGQVRGAGRLVPGGATAIGNAIDASVLWILGNGYRGERMIIDVSGDGRSNEGGSPALARAAANAAGITINGLAILNEEPDLGRYYIAGVVGGPGAFLMTAASFEDFAAAMRRKLYFEIVGSPVADAPGPPGRRPLRLSDAR
jgi:hypothetical protein